LPRTDAPPREWAEEKVTVQRSLTHHLVIGEEEQARAACSPLLDEEGCRRRRRGGRVRRNL